MSEEQAEQARLDANALRARLEASALNPAGLHVTELSAAQVRALVVALLWKAGGLNPDGTVRPLDQWL